VAASREKLLQSLGKALASVGHELNNIVGVVQSYAAFIEEAAEQPGIVDDVRVIRSSTDKALLIARQLLAFGHPREQGAEVLELGPFVIDLQGFLRRAFAGDCPVSVELGGEPVVISVRRAAFSRFLLDLIIALQEGFADGSGLTLSTQVAEQGGARQAELWLREARFDAAPTGRVAGLDLAWAKAAVEALGGSLQAELAAPSGVSLVLRFPALAAPAQPLSAVNDVAARGSETVLIVEENSELRQAICRMLEAAGYRALEAEDGSTARSLGLEGDVPLDLLLTSSSAPLSSSEQLASDLRLLHPNLGVLQQSKPFSSAELQGAVRAALDDRRRLSNQVPADAARVLALVVDDDPHVRLALSRILSDVGADVVTAPSGLHALQKLQALSIDLIIADQLMPGMEGMRLLETAYRSWPRVLRVVYTGYLSSALVVDAVNRANVHKVLAKDMPPELLREQLSEVVAEIRTGRAV
jgi:CheY-like chemotaxis protein